MNFENKIDILFAFGPMDPKIDLASEGLTRVIEQVVQGSAGKRDRSFRIVTHDWCRPSVETAFAKLLSTSQGQFTVKAMRSPLWFRARSRYHTNAAAFIRWANHFANTATISVIQKCLLILLVALTIYDIGSYIATRENFSARIIALFLIVIAGFVVIRSRGILRAAARRAAMVSEKIELWFAKHRQRLLGQADIELMKMINEGPATAVWVPTITSACSQLTKPWLYTFADWVPATFPTLYIDYPEFENRRLELNQLLRDADGISTFSGWVSTNHLPEDLRYRENEIHVIGHGPMDLMPLVGSTDRDAIAKSVSEKLRHLGLPQHLSDWNWEYGNFVIAPTQLRPHKNALNLFRAIEELNKKEFMNLRLVLTTEDLERPVAGIHLGEWLRARGLERQIVTVGRVSPELLAMLIHLATCVVSVSLFEAAVPFMFSEGTSTGTPVVLAANDVTKSEFCKIPVANRLLADPYNYRDIAVKIQDAVENRDSFFAEQQRIFHAYFGDTTWERQSDLYVQALEDLSHSSKRSN